MDFSTLPSLAGDDLSQALALDFSAADSTDEALDAARTERKAYVKAALEAGKTTPPTVAEVDAAEAVFASVGAIEAEQARRAAVAKEASDRFAALSNSFDTEAPVEADAENAEDGGEEAAEEVADDDADEADDAEGETAEGESDAGDGVTTASAVDHTRSARTAKPTAKSAAQAVAKGTPRPKRTATNPVVMTAAADISGFQQGGNIDNMVDLAKALQTRVKAFPQFSAQAGKAAWSANGNRSGKIHQAGVASLGMQFPTALTASGKDVDEYEAIKAAIKDHQSAMEGAMAKDQIITAGALTAAGWCAPSPVAYNYLTNYVVDGLLTLPEVAAPRGGLSYTTGPERGTQGTALDNIGWTQTEAQAEARTVKTFETIECPEFEDHRLDAIGYGVMIPILTKKAYPELVADALRYAAALYAHRKNRRTITDIVGMSTALAFEGYGPSFTDSLEALALIAVAERRKWSVGVNHVMEVKLPVIALEVFRADVSRRNGIAKESVSDSEIAKHFSDRRLAVEYVADWQETSVAGGTVALGGAFTAVIYPSGTFVAATEAVVNLNGIYDAASLSVNEYLGVFFEEAYLTLQMGYGSHKVSIPINTAGEQGALTLVGAGDNREDAGSF